LALTPSEDAWLSVEAGLPGVSCTLPARRTAIPPFGVKPRKATPHDFVLEALAAVSPATRPMFGCIAVYVEEKIVLILRDRRPETEDNGVWLATTEAHHESLRREFPNMRSIRIFSKDKDKDKVTGWQVLPADAPDFEESALRACELIAARDPRIGKVPKKTKAARRQHFPRLQPRRLTGL
jgi:hypothetical protein